MKNIEQQVLEAKAYNDTIKNSMSAKNKAELLFDDLMISAKVELRIRASICVKKDDILAKVVECKCYDDIKFANDEFFKELNYHLDNIIDYHSELALSLEPKVNELKAKKEARA